MKIICRWFAFRLPLLLLAASLPGALATSRAAVARPTLTFTNLKAGQRLTNDVLTVQGNTTSTLGVTNVLYQLSAGPLITAAWTNATPANTNNWTNWSAQINLTPGTNTLAAYAVDNSGNRSLTNTVKFVYVVFTTLTVNTNGTGTVTPNYNGQLLQIGTSYSMTGKSPISGFGLQNWTDGSNNVVTNTATLKFIMASNLVFTANFGDVTKPTVKVTSVSTNAGPGNLTLNGTASDNVAVTNVIYSLNHAAWTNASLVANGGDWTAQVMLTPGSNTVAVCTVDGSGNISATNTVKYFYVVLATLTVHTNGIGTITPNYNGAQLKIGAPYSMTGKSPINGFGVQNWTDGSNNIISTSSTLKFIMASNLTFTANFGDTARPVIGVKTTSTNTDGILNDFFVNGTAKDNVGVTNVFYRLNGGLWKTATTPNNNNWTNWSASVSLSPGLNYFYAYAVDTSSNSSVLLTAAITYNSAPLKLAGQSAIAIDNSGNSLFTVGFGTSTTTFSQAAQNPNYLNGVGTYTYAHLGYLASLKYKYTSPPGTAAQGSHPFTLTFYTPNYATFSTARTIATNRTDYTTNNLVITTNLVPTNVVVNLSGNIYFSSAANLVLTNASGQLIWSVDSQGGGNGTLFSNGTYSAQTLLSIGTNTGTYTYTKYSPVGSLFKLTDTNGTSYVVTSFAATNYGTYYSEDYDRSNHINGTGTGHFLVDSQIPGGNAPLTVSNRNFHIFSGDSDFNREFGDSTYSQASATTNFDNDVGDYTYTNADINIGQLNLTVTAPPANGPSNVLAGNTSAARLIFVGGNVGLFTNEDGTTFSSFVMTAATNFVPASITNLSLPISYGANIQFTNDGSFIYTVYNNPFHLFPNSYSGTYTYTPFSPGGAMVQLTYLDVSNNITGLDWLQLNFKATNSGNAFWSQFDTETNFLGNTSRTFSLH